MAPTLPRIKARADFLRAASRGRKWATPGLVLQARTRRPEEDEDQGGAGGREHAAPARVGFTASRKVGNAVARNRAKRRLRAVADQVLGTRARPGTDYVIIGRRATLDRPFRALLQDLETALNRVEAGGEAASGGRPRGRPRRGSARAPGES